MQKPSKWRFLADFYFSSKIAQTLQIDWKWTYQHCPGIILSDLSSIFAKQAMQNTVGFASENNGISEATHDLLLLS